MYSTILSYIKFVPFHYTVFHFCFLATHALFCAYVYEHMFMCVCVCVHATSLSHENLPINGTNGPDTMPF